MDFAVLNTSVCCPWDIVREEQGFLALQGGAAGGFALWHFPSVTYSTTRIVNYYRTVLSLMSTLSLNRLGIVTLTTIKRNVLEKSYLMFLDTNCTVVV